MTIRVELTPDGNPPIIYDIGTIIRPIADLSPEQLGLTVGDSDSCEPSTPLGGGWSEHSPQNAGAGAGTEPLPASRAGAN